MDEGFVLSDFIVGFIIGSTPIFIGGYFFWRKGKKERRFDERYETITNRAGAIAFVFTLSAVMIAGNVIFFLEGLGLSLYLFIGVYMVAILSFLICTLILNKRA